MNGLWGDLKLAVRRLARTPLFVLFAVSSLGLGVGVTTAVYSLIHSLLWQAPGVHEPGRLVVLTTEGRPSASPISRADLDELAVAQTTFTGLAASTRLEESLASDRAAGFVVAEAVTGNYFDTVGVGSALGRVIQAPDDQHRSAVVVLSDRLWRGQFDADPRVIGRIVRLRGQSFEVIGVARESFDGLGTGAAARTSAWIPLESAPLLDTRTSSAPEDRVRRRLVVVGRLGPGRTFQQAAAELKAIGERLDAAMPYRETEGAQNRRPKGTEDVVRAAPHHPKSRRSRFAGRPVLCGYGRTPAGRRVYESRKPHARARYRLGNTTWASVGRSEHPAGAWFATGAWRASPSPFWGDSPRWWSHTGS